MIKIVNFFRAKIHKIFLGTNCAYPQLKSSAPLWLHLCDRVYVLHVVNGVLFDRTIKIAKFTIKNSLFISSTTQDRLFDLMNDLYHRYRRSESDIGDTKCHIFE